MTDAETQRRIEEQIRAKVEGDYAAVRERTPSAIASTHKSLAEHGLPDISPEEWAEVSRRNVEMQIFGQMALAEEVWEEGGRQLPLSEAQLANLSVRNSMAKTEAAIRYMAERLDSLSPERRAVAADFLQMFKAQNERMARFRNVATMTESDLRQVSEAAAHGLSEVTERLLARDRAKIATLPPEQRAQAEARQAVLDRLTDPSLSAEERLKALKSLREQSNQGQPDAPESGDDPA